MFYYCIFDWGNLYHVARVEASDTLEAIEKMTFCERIIWNFMLMMKCPTISLRR